MSRAARRTGTGSRVIMCAAASCLAGAALTACSSDSTAAARPELTTSDSSPAAAASPTSGPGTPPTGSGAAAPSRSPGVAVPSAANTPTDVTQKAAGAFVPAPAPAPDPALAAVPAAAPGMDYADPLAVARGYVTARLTYRFDDPPGYTAALTAPAFTTAAFAARSTPSAAALARLATSQETSAVQVAGAEVEGEAPNSASTQYVVVTCTATTTYRGGGDTAPAAWTLRLVQATAGQWRVDGVLSTD